MNLQFYIHECVTQVIIRNKNQGVFVKHYMYAPGGNKAQKAFFSFNVKV